MFSSDSEACALESREENQNLDSLEIQANGVKLKGIPM